MPWWFWILLWLALIALSLLFYLLLGIRLFRQVTATFKELGEAGARFGHIDPEASATEADASAGTKAQGLAVFASPGQMRHDYEAAKAFRREVRRQRRVKRKAERGQPQSLCDIDFTKT